MTDDIIVQRSTFLNLAFHVNSIQQLVSHGAHLLGNPIAVFDSHYYTVAYSDTRGIRDDVWLGGKNRGYCLFEYAAMLHGLDHIRGHSAPFKIFDDFGPHRRRISPLISNSITIGYLTVLEYHHRFEEISNDLYDLVIGAITKEMVIERTIKQNQRTDSAEFLLVNLLNSEFANRLLFEERILGTEFEQNRQYRLLSIDMSSFHSKVTGEKNFKAQLATLFPKTWTTFNRSYVILLFDCLNYKIPENWQNMVSECLNRYGLFAGCSDVFSDLYSIRKHYQHAVTAELLARELGHSTTIAKYDDYKLWALAYSIKSTERMQYISAPLLRLWQADQGSGKDYVKTLLAYLESGESLEKTAQSLHIHRNTVVYRIEKMKERFGLNFESTYYNFQNYIGCMLLELSYLEKKKATNNQLSEGKNPF